MKKIKQITEIEVGDILAEPIINSYGSLLLPGGTPLNQNQIRMLKMWNIKTITIKLDLNDYDTWLNDDLIAWGYNIFSKKIDWRPRNEYEEDFYNLGVLYEARKVMLEMQSHKNGPKKIS